MQPTKGGDFIAYVPIPKDLSTIKTKVIFSLTKRQIICFASGLTLALPLFFLCKGFLGASLATLLMILTLLPFMLLAIYEKNGQPLEKVLHNLLQVCFIRPKVRPYVTNNFYTLLERQSHLDKEVYRIVHQTKSHGGPTKTN